MTNIFISARRGAGAPAEILYGTVTFKPTLAHSRATSFVLPAPTTFDLVDGEVVATNVQPTPAPVAGQIEWAYEVTFKDRHSKTYSFLVGVPDSTSRVNFTSLPRYFETAPPLFGQGPQGVPGESATLSVGTVTSGTTPNVTNSGTNTDAILNFTLPKGDKGDTGAGVPTGGTSLQYVRKNSGNTATEWATLNKASVGLSNVNNTSDANKPVSVATQTALNGIVNGLDDNVTVLAQDTDSTLGGYLNSKFVEKSSLVANVRDFGAVGDGATDDTAAFQEAIEYARGTFGQGGEVVITEGDYWFAGTVIMRDGVSLRGIGWPIIRRKFGDARYSLFAVLSEGRTGYGSGASNWSATGIEFRASFKAGFERSACAFAMHHGQNIEIHGNRFIEMHAKGHVVDLNACDNVYIHDNVFMGMQKLDGSGVAECIQFDQSKNGSLSHPDLAGSYDGLMSRNITIENNKFLPLTVDGVWYPASNIGGMHTTREGVYYENLKILNNYVEDPILVTSHTSRGNIHLEGAKGVTIRGNKFKSTRGGNTKLISARTVVVGNPIGQDPNIVQSVTTIPAQGCIDVLIENNEFEGFDGVLTSEYMIHIWGIPGSESVMTGIDLRGNKFRDNFSTGTGSDPIRVQDVAECTIDSTKCRGKNSRVFYAVGIQGFSALNNISEWSEIQPFWIENCSRRVQFQGNEWSSALNSPRARGCTDLIVSGNNATSPRAGVFGFVLEACERFYVGPNNFSTDITAAAAIALSGSANTKGTINNNNCYGYTASVQGTSSGVTIGTNPS